MLQTMDKILFHKVEITCLRFYVKLECVYFLRVLRRWYYTHNDLTVAWWWCLFTFYFPHENFFRSVLFYLVIHQTNWGVQEYTPQFLYTKFYPVHHIIYTILGAYYIELNTQQNKTWFIHTKLYIHKSKHFILCKFCGH